MSAPGGAIPGAAASFWTLDRVADALQAGGEGRCRNQPRGPAPLSGVSTDTRAVQPGELFVALIGERYDAHEFLADAVARGAAAVVVSRVEAAGRLGVPVFQVSDTLVALGALAAYRRRLWGGPVVGVGGSNGKTTTKELLRAALGSVLRVHASAGNLNNRVGVPLTLLALPDDADIAVVEMGTNLPGEVAMLRDITRPEIALVTSIGEEHLEGLESLAGVLREESALFAGAALAVTPAAQPEIGAAARGHAARVIEAGLSAGDLRADDWGLEQDGTGWIRLGEDTIRPPLRGAHNLANAMLALAIARECGVSLADAARGIATMPAPPMRSAWQPLGQATLINDAYNANPPSMRAAIDLLAAVGAGRQRVAVLGTMRELGPHAARLHEDVARHALAAPVDIVAGAGEMAEALRAVGGADERVLLAPDVPELWELLRPRLSPDAVLLLKASRGFRLERLVPLLSDWAGH